MESVIKNKTKTTAVLLFKTKNTYSKKRLSYRDKKSEQWVPGPGAGEEPATPMELWREENGNIVYRGGGGTTYASVKTLELHH